MPKYCTLVICSDCILGTTFRTALGKGVYFTPSPYRKIIEPMYQKSFHLRRSVNIRK